MKKFTMLALLAVAALIAVPVAAQVGPWDRTIYPGNCTKLFHVTTSTSTAYTDLVGKYGGDYVYKFSDYTTLDLVEGKITAGGVACILFYPGTYSFTDAWTVSKQVVIDSATGNPDDVNLDGDTNNVDIVIFADGSDGSIIRNVRMTLDNATSTEEDAITINSGADGVWVDNVTFIGSATAGTDAQGVVITGDRARVTNCYFKEVAVDSAVISVTGDDAKITDNVIVGSKASQYGILVNTSNNDGEGERTLIARNKIGLTAASSDIAIKITSEAINSVIADNQLYSADKISSGTTNSTLLLFENVNANITTSAWIAD